MQLELYCRFICQQSYKSDRGCSNQSIVKEWVLFGHKPTWFLNFEPCPHIKFIYWSLALNGYFSNDFEQTRSQLLVKDLIFDCLDLLCFLLKTFIGEIIPNSLPSSYLSAQICDFTVVKSWTFIIVLLVPQALYLQSFSFDLPKSTQVPILISQTPFYFTSFIHLIHFFNHFNIYIYPKYLQES